jgi:hypothetical protein
MAASSATGEGDFFAWRRKTAGYREDCGRGDDEVDTSVKFVVESACPGRRFAERRVPRK